MSVFMHACVYACLFVFVYARCIHASMYMLVDVLLSMHVNMCNIMNVCETIFEEYCMCEDIAQLAYLQRINKQLFVVMKIF